MHPLVAPKGSARRADQKGAECRFPARTDRGRSRRRVLGLCTCLRGQRASRHRGEPDQGTRRLRHSGRYAAGLGSTTPAPARMTNRIRRTARGTACRTEPSRTTRPNSFSGQGRHLERGYHPKGRDRSQRPDRSSTCSSGPTRVGGRSRPRPRTRRSSRSARRHRSAERA